MDATPEALNRSLQRSHRVVLGLIAACAIYSALQPQPATEAALDRRAATLAVALALGTIVAKQIASRATASPTESPPPRGVTENAASTTPSPCSACVGLVQLSRVWLWDG